MFGAFVVQFWMRHAETGCFHEQSCVRWRRFLSASIVHALAMQERAS